jgi:hypothetical protein
MSEFTYSGRDQGAIFLKKKPGVVYKCYIDYTKGLFTNLYDRLNLAKVENVCTNARLRSGCTIV